MSEAIENVTVVEKPSLAQIWENKTIETQIKNELGELRQSILAKQEK